MAEAERLITPGTRLVVVNSPHNPSGAHFSQQEWRRLGELCQAAGAHLFRCGGGGVCVSTGAAAAWTLLPGYCLQMFEGSQLVSPMPNCTACTACTAPAWPVQR